MYSVTQRVKHFRQPYGGYIQFADLKRIDLNDGVQLNPTESIAPGVIGTVIDYMLRYLNGTPKEKAFQVSLQGAALVGKKRKAAKLLKAINGIDETSLSSACELVEFDIYKRISLAAFLYGPPRKPKLDDATLFNMQIMIQRAITFFDEYGPIVIDGFTFEGGYTNIISSGDGDILTTDTLWEIKTTKRNPNPQHTLQLLCYYIMGCHSIHSIFQTINRLGIFNPRLNRVFTIDTDAIDPEIIETVSTKVIGYPPDPSSFVRKNQEKQGELDHLIMPTRSHISTPRFHFGEIKDKEIYKR